eukprot:8495-Heterococcus_DN1.PRE.8
MSCIAEQDITALAEAEQLLVFQLTASWDVDSCLLLIAQLSAHVRRQWPARGAPPAVHHSTRTDVVSLANLVDPYLGTQQYNGNICGEQDNLLESTGRAQGPDLQDTATQTRFFELKTSRRLNKVSSANFMYDIPAYKGDLRRYGLVKSVLDKMSGGGLILCLRDKHLAQTDMCFLSEAFVVGLFLRRELKGKKFNLSGEYCAVCKGVHMMRKLQYYSDIVDSKGYLTEPEWHAVSATCKKSSWCDREKYPCDGQTALNKRLDHTVFTARLSAATWDCILALAATATNDEPHSDWLVKVTAAVDADPLVWQSLNN